MKVIKIEFKNYLNFEENLEIDLTYPPGHEKAGMPLDKVCFLGQSGTGKTTILNLIKSFSFEDFVNPFCLDQSFLSNENVGVHFLLEENEFKFSKWSGQPSLTGDVELIYKHENSLSTADCKKVINDFHLNANFVRLVYFPFDVIRTQLFSTTASKDEKLSHLDVIQSFDNSKGNMIEKTKEYLERRVWDFSIDNIAWLWDIVLDQILDYEAAYTAKMKDCINRAKKDKENSKIYMTELEEWEALQENPIKKLAKKCIDDILKTFNLKVDTGIDFTQIDHRKFLRIQQINNNVTIPDSFLSTGTKQIVFTSLPLSILNIDKAIILFDEPERSLYPDVQVKLISTYASLAPNSQFFFATHSPIIASAFEPWEIIELKFNGATNKIGIEPYYKGERKVDNYTIYPQYLPYGNIYTDVFDLDMDYNQEFRGPQLTRLAELKKQALALKGQVDKKEELDHKILKIIQEANKAGIDLSFYLKTMANESN